MKILTANRLTDGEAVWLCADHSWAETIDVAEIARDAATEEKLERAGKAALCKNEVVDLALVDIDLADGPTGPQAAAWLRERGIPSIFVTGQTQIAVQYTDVCRGIITKPVSSDDLAEKLELFVDVQARAIPEK